MNMRQMKKRNKKCTLGILDEMHIIGMTEQEIDQDNKNREEYRNKYGYRKKYKSKSPVKYYFYSPTVRQQEQMINALSHIYNKHTEFTIIQSIDQLEKAYNS